MSSVEDLQLRYETIAIGSAFEELLSLAQKSCLSTDVIYATNLEQLRQKPATEAHRLAQQIGLWPAREIFDNYAEANRPVDMEGAFSRRNIAKIDTSDFPALPLNPEIQNQIEALGQSILDEAFLCLGADAPAQVERFKQAQTSEEKADACQWLDQRIIAIYEKFRGAGAGEEAAEDAFDKYFHHPMKLSPKIIGQYPDIRLRPTCLGVSILVASFCEQTGARYLHGGVATTADKTVRLRQRQLLPAVGRAIKSVGGEVPEHALKKLIDARMMLGHFYWVSAGFHADALLDLGGGDWMQIDPYFQSTTLIKDAAAIEKTYEALVDSGIRGAEAMVYDDMSAKESAWRPFIRRLATNVASADEVDDFLAGVTANWGDQEIIKQYFGPFFDLDKKSARPIKFITDQMVDYHRREDPEIDRETYLWGVIHESVIDYVFPEASEDFDIFPYIKKCQSNPEYRRQCAENLRTTPLLALLKLQSEFADLVARHEIPKQHALTEVGLPAYRIGASVLSDFAVYCGDELPFSFWATYWPSHIPFAEHMEGMNSKAQAKLGKAVVDMIKRSRLTYGDVYLRIS